MKRQAISKKVRFEVFKRDSFTCQYCGQKAPDVILHIDHIVPVGKKGKNDILNLVTACQACNAGKSDTLLDDSTSVQKARKQAIVLQERREQIEMMAAWMAGLRELNDRQVKVVEDEIEGICGWRLNENGKAGILKLIRKHGLQAVIDGTKKSFEYNMRHDGDSVNEYSIELSLKRIPAAITWAKRLSENPKIEGIYYAFGILKNRFRDAVEQKEDLIERMTGMTFIDTTGFIEFAKTCDSVDDFYEKIGDEEGRLIDEEHEKWEKSQKMSSGARR